MKRRTFLRPLLLATLLALPFSRDAHAAPVTVESTAFGPMTGFELFGNGLFWWNSGNPPNEVTPSRTGQIAIRSLLAGRALVLSSSKNYFALQTTALRAPYQSVGRTDDDLFYFENTAVGLRFFKRAVFGSSPNEIDFSGVAYSEPGAVIVHGLTVYWNARGGAAANNGEVRWKSVNGGPGGGDAILRSGMGLVKKMKVIPVYDEDGNFFRNYLFMLNTSGELWHIPLPSLFFPTVGSLTFYANNVTDFDTRQESARVFVPPFSFRQISATKLYATTGANLSSSRISGRLVSFNLTSGGTVTEYDSQNVNVQLTGVTLDVDRIFLTSTPLRFDGVVGGFGGWVYDSGNSQILRKAAPASSDTVFLSPFETIAVLQEGGNLRSDRQWLYYTHQNQVRKIKTDAPAVALDYRAIGFEVVQAVQDYNNSVPIVAGKPTLVRGYAQMLQNTTGYRSFPVYARLRAFRGPVQLSGEVFSDYPLLDGAADLATIRTDVNRNFFFDLPQEWLAEAGTLRLEMTVNPNVSAPETGATPLANNTVSATITINKLATPCLIFSVMSSTMPNYDPQAPGSGFGDILDRALTQLPAPNFRFGFRSGSFAKPVVTLTGLKWRSFAMPGDADWALTLLSLAQLLEKNPAGCPDTHWVGMFPSSEPKFNGLGERPGDTLLIRMGQEQSQAGSAWSGPRGGFALAHELAHNYGRKHIDTPTNCTSQVPDGPYDSYGSDPCTLGITSLLDPAAPIGYDYRSGQLILPSQAGDLMTYARTRWISPENWRALINALPGREGPADGLQAAPPPAGPVLLVQGFINTSTHTGLLLPAIHGESGVFDDTLIQRSIDAALALPANAPERVRLLDANGTVLLDYPAVTTQFSDGPEESVSLQQFLPHDPAAVRVQLVTGGAVVAELTASANTPVVTVDPPIVDAAAETLTLNWAGSDGDGDPLLFAVQFSPDDGATWQTMRVLDPSFSCTVGTRLLPGGDTCRMRVIASDGFNTTVATTEPFALAKHAPSVILTGVRDQQPVPYGTRLSVRAFAYDAEDGSLDPGATQWLVAGPEVRSEIGATFSLRGLAPGHYTLTASATDADGNTAVTTLTFDVQPIVVADGAVPAFDGLGGEAAWYAATTEVRLVPERVEPTVRFAHADGYLYVAFSGLPMSDPDVAPANINFYINADGAADGTPHADDIGFGVDENGVPYESRGNGTTLVAQQPRDFSVQIMRSLSTWSAEFRVPESAIGGWNHPASIAFYFGRSHCVSIPFLGCTSVPDAPVFWPSNADLFNPATWAPVSFGPLPPSAGHTPVALASGPAVVGFDDPQNVALDGSGSYDLDGDLLTYSWAQTEGPSVALQDATTPAPWFTTPELSSTAVVKFQLVVNDGQADSAPAEVALTLAPSAPASTTPTLKQTPVTISAADGSATIQLCWPGAAGDLAVIQASTDLVNWETIGTNTVGYLQSLVFTDANAGLHPHRFYRAVSWQPTSEPAGAALQFHGGTDVVEVAHDTALNAFPLTASFWLKTTDTNSARGLLTKYADGSLNGYALYLSEGSVRGWYFRNGGNYVWDGGAGLNGGFVADGKWHHLALVVDAASARIYLDGTLTASRAWTGVGGPCTSAEPLQFGRYFSYPAGLNGQLDEISLWHRALTEAEINRLIPGQLTGGEADLLGYWRFDEGTGATTADGSGHGRDGVLKNGPTWIESTAPIHSNPVAGTALRFDGLNDSVQVNHAAALNAFPLTVTAWVKTAQISAGYVAVANKYVSASGNGYTVLIHNGHLYGFYFRGDGVSRVYVTDPGLDGGFIADGRWHHVAYLVDETGGRLYVDGVERASLGWTGTPGPCTTTTPLTFGRYPFNGQTLSLAGRIDEVTLWNRALSEAELQVVRRFTQTGAGTGLLGHWRFDDDAGSTATDATGHGYNGALLNGPIWVNSDAPIYP